MVISLKDLIKDRSLIKNLLPKKTHPKTSPCGNYEKIAGEWQQTDE